MPPMLRPLTAAAMLCLFANAGHAASQDFRLFNNTGYSIDKVFVSAVGVKSWEEDILGQDTLDDGESVNITFQNAQQGCRYDLKVVYHDGDNAVWSNVNLCELSKIHIHWDKSAGVTRATGN